MAKDTVRRKIGKTMVKFYVIREPWGDVKGYRLGEYTLSKHYGWGNSYSWVISKDDVPTMDCEFWRTYNKGCIETVSSCKAGWERLVDLYIADVRL